MADLTKLNADNAEMAATLADMSAKLDAFLAKAPPADDQPAVDAAASAVEQNIATAAAIAAKIPA